MRFNRKQFFDSYRASFGAIQQLQVDGLGFLLTKIEADPEWDSLPQIAYFLATIKHETGISRNKVDQTFQPIRELRAKAGTAGRRNQDRYWLSGYYGRGYIQLTWKDNYAKFGLADVPDDALEPDTAYMVAARGMREGKFTKYKLSDFINDSEVDYHGARRVVNGLDRAEHIAGLAQKFERILRGSLVTDPVTDPAKTEAPEKPTPQINVEHADTVEASPIVAKPETVKIESLTQSLLSKVMAGGTAAVGAMTAIFGFVTQAFDRHPLPLTILVLGILAISAYLWNESKKRRDSREALLVQKAASQTENTVVLTEYVKKGEQ